MEQAEVGKSEAGLRFSISRDLAASVVVFLVALPLCMGIAVASGVPVASGLFSGIIGGLVTGPVAGSPLQVSGPAAGLTVIVFETVQEFGLAQLGLIVFLAGLIQALAGWLKLGQFFRAVSPAVIHGMLAGIGVLIFASQFHVMIDDKPASNGLKNLMAIPGALVKGVGIPYLETLDQRQEMRDLLQRASALAVIQRPLEQQVRDVTKLPAAGHGEVVSVKPAPPAAEKIEFIRGRLAELRSGSEAFRAIIDQSKLTAERKELLLRHCGELERTITETDEAASQGDLEKLLHGSTTLRDQLALLTSDVKNHQWAALIGLITITVIVLWMFLAPKKISFIPGPLVAILVSTAVAFLLVLPVLYVQIPADLTQSFQFINVKVLQSASWGPVLGAALLIAAIASAETLLCATAVDQMHQGPRTKYDRELFAQGLGNMVCGMVGALPMTGVIVRSAANVQAGATSRLSAIMHGLWLLLFVGFLASSLRLIPTSALAGILVYTGLRLVRIKDIKHLWHTSVTELLIYAATLSVVVVEDLLTGVLVGLALSAIKILWVFSRLDVKMDLQEGSAGDVKLNLHGAATFIKLPKLATQLEKVPAGAKLHVDLTHLSYIDHACLDLLTNWAKQHQATGGELIIDWDSLHASFRSGGKSVK